VGAYCAGPAGGQNFAALQASSEAPFPKKIGQADGGPRQNFLFDTSLRGISVDFPQRTATVVVVTENDPGSKDTARRVCEKHAGETLCTPLPIRWPHGLR
jgi:hypothetical protein